jgi:hypothetical protein
MFWYASGQKDVDNLIAMFNTGSTRELSWREVGQ